jgi:hypothetical protein
VPPMRPLPMKPTVVTQWLTLGARPAFHDAASNAGIMKMINAINTTAATQIHPDGSDTRTSSLLHR